MVYVSFSLRMTIDVEALNMVEPTGSYVKHRMVPIVYPRGPGYYRIINAPAVSGQSLAYAYQEALVKLALERGLPVCEGCKNYRVIGGFVKQTGDITKCVVEDITGYMIAKEERQLANRRTSTVSFSYMIPDVHSVIPQIVPQMHVRYHFLKPKEQALYEIESASAIYTLSVSIDANRVGKLEIGVIDNDRLKVDVITVNDVDKRLELVFDALVLMLEGLTFGAKKSRYKPHVEVLGAVATVSHPYPFEASPARVRRQDQHYINETIERAKEFLEVVPEQEISVYFFTDSNKEELIIKDDIPEQLKGRLTISRVKSLGELIATVRNAVLNRLEQGGRSGRR